MFFGDRTHRFEKHLIHIDRLDGPSKIGRRNGILDKIWGIFRLDDDGYFMWAYYRDDGFADIVKAAAGTGFIIDHYAHYFGPSILDRLEMDPYDLSDEDVLILRMNIV